jgi:uroporphyrinogen decarboxylase
MVAGSAAPDQMPARRLALEAPERLRRLIDMLTQASAAYLVAQAKAGADVLKIFDSWSGVLDEEGFRRWAIEPVREIVRCVRADAPGVPIIAFPKGAGTRLGEYAEQCGADAVAVDWTLPMHAACKMVPERTALQGNLDPLRLVVGGAPLAAGIDSILKDMRGHPHIFNLGHGIIPETPPDHVARLVAQVRGGAS